MIYSYISILSHFCLLVTKLNDIQWNLFDVKTTNNLHDIHLPVVTMNVNYDDHLENKPKTISFSLNAEQFAILYAGRISHHEKKTPHSTSFHSFRSTSGT